MYRPARTRYIWAMASVGYARVSPLDQNLGGQTDALEAAACGKVSVADASGVLSKRPALDDALGYLRNGDALVVTKLDRLGRSVHNLKKIVDDLQLRGMGLKALPQGIDTTTSGGWLFFHMLAVITLRGQNPHWRGPPHLRARSRGRLIDPNRVPHPSLRGLT